MANAKHLRFAASFLLLVALWAFFGVVHGLHWLWLALLQRKASAPSTCRCCAHFAIYILCTLCTALGGTWCRSSGAYLHCPCADRVEVADDAECLSMSRHCFQHTQGLAYQTVYLLHYVSLSCQGAHWVVDGAHLWRWASDAVEGRALSMLWESKLQEGHGLVELSRRHACNVRGYDHAGTTSVLHSAFVCVVLPLSTVIITLSWTVLVPWSTEPGQGQGDAAREGREVSTNVLAIIFVLEICFVFAVSGLAVQARSRGANSSRAACCTNSGRAACVEAPDTGTNPR